MGPSAPPPRGRDFSGKRPGCPTDNKRPRQHLNVRTAITYRDAGVDIDAGNALVEAIKPLARPRAGRAPMPISAASAACSI